MGREAPPRVPGAVARLWSAIESDFERRFPRSAAFHREHRDALLDGGSHAVGHNPSFLLRALTETLQDGRGLQSGMIHAVEAEVAERLCAATGCETVRFTTAGTLGTFYATVLARAFTGRDKVVKISGGWHGSQPYGLKGVTPHHNRMQRMGPSNSSSIRPTTTTTSRTWTSCSVTRAIRSLACSWSRSSGPPEGWSRPASSIAPSASGPSDTAR